MPEMPESTPTSQKPDAKPFPEDIFRVPDAAPKAETASAPEATPLQDDGTEGIATTDTTKVEETQEPQSGKETKKGGVWIAVAAGAAAVVTVVAGFAGAFGGNRTAATPAPMPSASGTLTTGPRTESPTAPVETTPAATPTATTSETPSAEPTESATTPEKQGNETLTNIDTKELSPELAAIYNSIADKVQAGDITHEKYLKFDDNERALVEQALLYRVTQHGPTNLDISICYMNMKYIKEDPECNANFASKDDRNEAVYGKYLGVLSAPVAYTNDEAWGSSDTLDPEASRILLNAAFNDPGNATADSRFGYIYSTMEKWIDKGKKVKFNGLDIDVSDAKEGQGDSTRTLKITTTHSDSTVEETRAILKYMTYEIDGKDADKLLGLERTQKLKIARWELVSGRTIS